MAQITKKLLLPKGLSTNKLKGFAQLSGLYSRRVILCILVCEALRNEEYRSESKQKF